LYNFVRRIKEVNLMALEATYLGANGWLIEFGPFKILIDPWLRGDLIFSKTSWLLRGELTSEIKIPNQISLILLTQGLADHAHQPTLKILAKSIPVVASESAAKVAERLGFRKVTPLKNSSTHQIDELKITATKGAPIPMHENGYIIEHPMGTVYIEPHGFLDESIKVKNIDLAITPIVDVKIPILGSIIKGLEVVSKIEQELKPGLILASTTGGDIKYSGLLSMLLIGSGDIIQAKNKLKNPERIVQPIVGKKYSVRSINRVH